MRVDVGQTTRPSRQGQQKIAQRFSAGKVRLQYPESAFSRRQMFRDRGSNGVGIPTEICAVPTALESPPPPLYPPLKRRANLCCAYGANAARLVSAARHFAQEITSNEVYASPLLRRNAGISRSSESYLMFTLLLTVSIAGNSSREGGSGFGYSSIGAA